VPLRKRKSCKSRKCQCPFYASLDRVATWARPFGRNISMGRFELPFYSSRERSESGVYDISVGSMNIDDRPTDQRLTSDRPQGPFNQSHILGKFQMAITLQRVNTFSGTADRTAPFPVGSNPRSKMAAGGDLKKTLKDHISETHYPIHFRLCNAHMHFAL